jgi:hypothetical protein
VVNAESCTKEFSTEKSRGCYRKVKGIININRKEVWRQDGFCRDEKRSYKHKELKG